jgi:hypothetical protein
VILAPNPAANRTACKLRASEADSMSLIFVTHNEADFRDYPGLLVENWVQ